MITGNCDFGNVISKVKKRGNVNYLRLSKTQYGKGV